MTESLTSEFGLERAPKILAVSLYRAYPRYAHERVYAPEEVFWLAESRVDERQSVLIRGEIDPKQERVVDALRVVDVGVVSIDAAASMWLRVSDPSRLLSLPSHVEARRGTPDIDSYSEMFLEHMVGLTPQDGRG